MASPSRDSRSPSVNLLARVRIASAMIVPGVFFSFGRDVFLVLLTLSQCLRRGRSSTSSGGGRRGNLTGIVDGDRQHCEKIKEPAAPDPAIAIAAVLNFAGFLRSDGQDNLGCGRFTPPKVRHVGPQGDKTCSNRDPNSGNHATAVISRNPSRILFTFVAICPPALCL